MAAAPGWHPDQQQPGLLRWWDGQQWTEHTKPMPEGPSGGAPPPAGTPLWKKVTVGAVGVVAAFLLLAVIGGLMGDDEPAPVSEADSSEATTPAAEPTTEPAEPADDPTFPGGNALSSYEGFASYPWREAVVQRELELLADLRTVKPLADEGIFRDVISTCDDVDQGKPAATVRRNAALRFSDGDGSVTAAEAQRLVEISRTVCPDAG